MSSVSVSRSCPADARCDATATEPLRPDGGLVFGSVCSGIEAASQAWHPLGWRAAFVSEIEAFPRAVLQHRWPEAPLHGDFTTIQAGQYEPIDLLVGGTPCQSFSVAGLRGGLSDERGNLALEYLRLADRLRPRWLVWENVPGVLSSNGGRDFGSILGGMGELGYGVAYRVLDAQFFGVAQRRRRVFVVGYLGDWRRAAAVLFERHGLSGHPAPRREAREGVAPTISARPSGGGGLGTDFDCDGGLVEAPCGPGVAGTLNANGKAAGSATQQDAEQGMLVVAFGGNNTAGSIDVATAVNAHGGPHGRQDFESETFVVGGAFGEMVQSDAVGPQRAHGADAGHGSEALVAHTLKGEGFDASEDGTGRGTPIVPVTYSIMPQNSGKDYKARQVDVAQPVMAGGPVGGNQGGDYVLTLAIRGRGDGHNLEWRADGTANAILTPNGGRAGMGVGAVAFDLAQITSAANRTRAEAGLPVSTLSKESRAHVAFNTRQDPIHGPQAQPLGAKDNGHGLLTGSAVRRLTPRECERLQGFPDEYTLIPWRKGEAPDGPRYKALGNSMAVPVMAWIGRRIEAVEAIGSQRQAA